MFATTSNFSRLHFVTDSPRIKKKLGSLLEEAEPEALVSTRWETVAADEIKRYTEMGLALRGARYREGLSQKQLAKRCGISQNNLSKIENGKRIIGEKVAKKLAKALRLDYRFLLKLQAKQLAK